MNPELRARVLESVKREPSPTRAQVMRTTAVLLAGGAAAAAAVFVSVGGMHAVARPPAFVAATAIGWGLVAAIATAIAFARGKASLGAPRTALVIVSLLTGPVLLAWSAMWTMQYPELREPAVGWGVHAACFATTLLLAAGPFVALAIARRGTDPVHPGATGAALGAAAGAWAGVMIDLHCEVSSEAHVAMAHVLPALLLAAAGALIGRRVVAIRA